MRNWKFNHIDFSTYPNYNGEDLGVFWTPEKTYVKIWAPTARIVELRLYKNGETGEAFHKTNLQPSGNGIWLTSLVGDYSGKFYTLRINDGEWLDEVPDIYARCVGINGERGMIYDPAKTNPENWQNDKSPEIKTFTDAIIYEIHVRDFSIAESSGMENKGKFLAFAEKETVSVKGVKTGLNHLKELGITHVHLLPVNDFATVNEEKPLEKYNWGYDPLHYNALEGSYSRNPENGPERILEFKKLVQALHEQNLGVILDVVYNHTYFAKESVFNQTVPGYFYRQKPDGTFSNASGCGNEIASERFMVRKYILDSLTYWMNEFHVDGFRFDLMGIMDLETMNIIESELRKINPGVILYGEGWTADASPMSENLRAVKNNMQHLPGIAAFNDNFRDALKGNHGNKKSTGFVSGLSLREESVKLGIVGGIHHPEINFQYIDSLNGPWLQNPNQCINYVSCHDNFTLWDKLKFSLPKATDEELKERVKLAGAIVLLSQGIPFLHAGVEFCRTKGGNGNSYKSPDNVNQIDWDRKAEFIDVFEYFRKIIELRKNHPAFRISNSEYIRKAISFCTEYKIGAVSFCILGNLVGDKWRKIVVMFNGNKENIALKLPEGNFKKVCNKMVVNENGLDENVYSSEVEVDPVSTTIFAEL